MPNPFRVFAMDRTAPPAAIESEILKGVADVICLDMGPNDDPPPILAEADAAFCHHQPHLNRRAFSIMKKCRAVVRVGVGYDTVDLRAAGEAGIRICNVPDYGTYEVADHAMGLLLAVARKINALSDGLRQGPQNWDWALCRPVGRLWGRTLGIVGFGRIGMALAQRARAFGLRIVFYDPYVPDGRDKALGVERAETLEALMPQCDFLSLHCPLTPETRHILSRERIALLKPGAMVINTARGPCCDTVALLEALRDGRIAGAGLDVLEVEPPATQDIFRAFAARAPETANLVLTPHSAFFSEEGEDELRRKCAMEIRRVLTGEGARNCVNEEFLARRDG